MLVICPPDTLGSMAAQTQGIQDAETVIRMQTRPNGFQALRISRTVMRLDSRRLLAPACKSSLCKAKV